MTTHRMEMDPRTHRAMLAAQLDLAGTLVGHLDEEGLRELRYFLRDEGTVQACLGSALVGVRANLLDRACRLLADRGVGSVEGFAAAGDVLPAVPDSPGAMFDVGTGEGEH